MPAKTDKDIPARWYIKIERDPERAAYVENRQNEVILALLQRAHDTQWQGGWQGRKARMTLGRTARMTTADIKSVGGMADPEFGASRPVS